MNEMNPIKGPCGRHPRHFLTPSYYSPTSLYREEVGPI